MISHVNADTFCNSVEERDWPELVGQPVIVGGMPEKQGRGDAVADEIKERFGVEALRRGSSLGRERKPEPD
jgi:DNA polymerase IV